MKQKSKRNDFYWKQYHDFLESICLHFQVIDRSQNDLNCNTMQFKSDYESSKTICRLNSFHTESVAHKHQPVIINWNSTECEGLSLRIRNKQINENTRTTLCAVQRTKFTLCKVCNVYRVDRSQRDSITVISWKRSEILQPHSIELFVCCVPTTQSR